MSDQRPGKPPRPSKAERKNEAREKARRMREEAERRQKRNRVLIAVGAVVAVLVVVLGIGLIVQSASDNGTETATAPSNVGEAGQIVVGQDSAPVTVSVYLDYQCPVCKSFEDANQDMLESLQEEGKIKIEYHPISILDRYSGGTMYSTRAAGAAMCVADQAPEAFPEFNKQMFANQPPENAQGLTNEKIATIATLAGAPESIATCIEDDTFEGFVQTTTQEALESGVGATPTVFVSGPSTDGRVQVTDWETQSLRQAIDDAA